MTEAFQYGSRAGAAGGWRGDLPLSTDAGAFALDLRGLGACHPMFLVRLRTFLEWHALGGSEIEVLLPTDAAVAEHLSAMEVFADVPVTLDRDLPAPSEASDVVLPAQSVRGHGDVEKAADDAVAALERRGGALGSLASAFHMAISEFGDNALTHGRNELGTRLAAAISTDSTQGLTLAIGDLGMGIPEHIRQTHPEWGDDTAAIAQAIQPGVSGVRNRHRGYGFLHIQEAALTARLAAARMEIYSANGFLRLDVVQGTFVPTPLNATVHKRGSWISYSIVSAGS